jgi:hypothetical protein
MLAPGWLYATMLRDPIDRFLSHYYFYRGQPQEPASRARHAPEVAAAKTLCVEDYIRHPRFGQLATNVQARHFAWRMHDAPDRLTETQLFEAAVASLREYDLVGVFADVQGFLDLYCDRPPSDPATTRPPHQCDGHASSDARHRHRGRGAAP